MTVATFPQHLRAPEDALMQALRNLTKASEPLNAEKTAPLPPWA